MPETVGAQPPSGDQYQALLRAVVLLGRNAALNLTPAQLLALKVLLQHAGVIPPYSNADSFDSNWF